MLNEINDQKLLNDAREKLEEIIDVLHDPHKGEQKKMRTYRQRARKDYLKVIKKRRPSKLKIRSGIRKQLQYVARNLRHIGELGTSKEFEETNGRKNDPRRQGKNRRKMKKMGPAA